MAVNHLHVFELRIVKRVQSLLVLGITVVVDTLNANGKTQIDAVIDIAAQIEVVFTDITRLGTIECVVVRIDVVVEGVTCLRICARLHHLQTEFIDHTDTIATG